MLPDNPTADICLILEGTYPYTVGGVSSWTHELITMQKHLTFSLVTLISADAPTKLMYELPPNVISLHTTRLQCLPEGCASLPAMKEHQLFDILEESLLRLQSDARLEDLENIIKALAPYQGKIGQRLLLDSASAWNLLLRMYNETMPKASFLDYFWSWRVLFGGLFSVLLSKLPQAKAYHALCTGYAGLLLARAHVETGRPCVVTEHGIYTNERRIEIASSDWLDDPHAFNLVVNSSKQERDLKDLWIDTFSNYSRMCYAACSQVITLYEGNQEFQRMDGAAPDKLRVIPNGIDINRYAGIEYIPHPPTIALIGRVVPIKDIKSYIKAVYIIKQSLPAVRAFMIGPSDEEPEYAQECQTLVEHLELQNNFIFTGKVDIADYLGSIDVIILSSISEAQPLVILEAGAAGIPTVATNVGACSEMIMGSTHENPHLGAGGGIVPLFNPPSMAKAVLRLLTEPDYYKRCSHAIRERVRRYYRKEDQYTAYAGLYQSLMESNGVETAEENSNNIEKKVA